jgi:NAD(P)-dependent dehydrogenase (short-subunit alcohol dehydrogenase family)
MTLNNKHAVVTGGGSGVGAAIALKLAENEVKVTILGRRDKPLKAIANKHENIDWRVCDVTNANDLEECYNNIRKKFGKINIIIANAGEAFSKPFHKMSSKDISSIMDVNVIGVFNTFKYALEDMESEGWGRMIAISSTAGLKGYSYVSAYCASKHAVIGLTRSLAMELAKKGITVNSVCPSYIDTPMTERTIANITKLTNLSSVDAIQELVSSNPQKRLILPSEVAETILWLCKDTSNSINGQSISIAGGEI